MAPKEFRQRRAWEKRAGESGLSPQGVLYKGLSAPVNAVLHEWHSALIRRFATNLPPGALVADLGAGYGRLSRELKVARPDVSVLGVDYSAIFCRHYRAAEGPAICADLARLPVRDACWDGLMAVTVLMYVDQDQVEIAVARLMRSLKPGGIGLFVDPGAEITRWLRRIGHGAAGAGPDGTGFERRDYRAIFERCGGAILASGSNAWFSLSLPLLRVLAAQPRQCANVGRWITAADMRLGCNARWALHRWMLVQRENSDVAS